MHEHNGDGIEAIPARGLQPRAQGLQIERALHRAIGQKPLVHLLDPLIELLGQDDFLGEDIWPCLIGDPELVAQPFRNQKKGALPLALQKRIRGDRRSHAHRADGAGRDGCAGFNADQAADALDGRVLVGFGILGQKLHRVEFARWRAPDDVGEGASAVDPEVPHALRHSPNLHLPTSRR